MIKWISLAIGFYCVLNALLFLLQRQLTYFPDKSAIEPYRPAYMQQVRITHPSGSTLEGWWHPPQAAQPTIIFFHGNGGNLSSRMEKMAFYAQKGYGLLMASYRGYATNPGSPTESGLYADANLFYDWVVSQGIAGEDIVLFGESLGSAVAVKLATEHPIQAVVLEVPLNSAVAIGKARFPWVFGIDQLLKDRFESDQRIHLINAPLLIGVAGKDYIVPPKYGIALFDAAIMPKVLHEYPKAHHMNLFEHGFNEDVDAFLSNVTSQ